MPTIEQPVHVQTQRVNGRTYEQRYSKCSKSNCWCSKPPFESHQGHPGHGPYWYRVINKDKRVIRRYIGKELITDGNS